MSINTNHGTKIFSKATKFVLFAVMLALVFAIAFGTTTVSAIVASSSNDEAQASAGTYYTTRNKAGVTGAVVLTSTAISGAEFTLDELWDSSTYNNLWNYVCSNGNYINYTPQTCDGDGAGIKGQGTNTANEYTNSCYAFVDIVAPAKTVITSIKVKVDYLYAQSDGDNAGNNTDHSTTSILAIVGNSTVNVATVTASEYGNREGISTTSNTSGVTLTQDIASGSSVQLRLTMNTYREKANQIVWVNQKNQVEHFAQVRGISISVTGHYDFNGTGTSADPNRLEEYADFNALSSMVVAGNTFANTYFKVAPISTNGQTAGNNGTINMLNNTFTPIGSVTAKFQGVVDMNGCSIYNLKANRSSGYAGLFGYLGSSARLNNVATASNSNPSVVQISGSVGANGGYVGGLVGYAESGAVVSGTFQNNATVSGGYKPANATYQSADLSGDIGITLKQYDYDENSSDEKIEKLFDGNPGTKCRAKGSGSAMSFVVDLGAAQWISGVVFTSASDNVTEMTNANIAAFTMWTTTNAAGVLATNYTSGGGNTPSGNGVGAYWTAISCSGTMDKTIAYQRSVFATATPVYARYVWINCTATGGNAIQAAEFDVLGCGSYVGGIAGYYTAPSSNITFSSYVNTGAITGGDYVGGFFGRYDAYGSSGVTSTFTACKNTGTIVGGNYVGGFFGYENSHNNTSSSHINLTDCENKANVTSYGGNVGGFSSYLRDCTITHCISGGSWTDGTHTANTYTISGAGNNIGGFLGGTDGFAFVNGASNNVNYSRVTSTATANFVGGIAGYVNWGVLSNSIVNYGTIGSNTSSNVGGIVGKIHPYSTTASGSSVTNNGAVSGVSYVGGLVGYGEHSVVNTYTYLGTLTNNGTVTATNNYVGGIFGYCSESNDGSSITATNTKAIQGASYVGGIIGYLNATQLFTLTGCANTASVTGSGNGVAGIVGYTAAGIQLMVENSHNSGVITSSSSANGIAGIVGYMVGGANRIAILRCSNTAQVIGGVNTGGIGGRIDSNSTTSQSSNISHCYNSGEVQGVNTIGGIVGYFYAHTDSGTPAADTGYIGYCVNEGKVSLRSGTASNFGGIAGNPTSYTTIEYCYNTASAIVNATTASCGSIVGTTASTVRYSYAFFTSLASNSYLINNARKGNYVVYSGTLTPQYTAASSGWTAASFTARAWTDIYQASNNIINSFKIVSHTTLGNYVSLAAGYASTAANSLPSATKAGYTLVSSGGSTGATYGMNASFDVTSVYRAVTAGNVLATLRGIKISTPAGVVYDRVGHSADMIDAAANSSTLFPGYTKSFNYYSDNGYYSNSATYNLSAAPSAAATYTVTGVVVNGAVCMGVCATNGGDSPHLVIGQKSLTAADVYFAYNGVVSKSADKWSSEDVGWAGFLAASGLSAEDANEKAHLMSSPTSTPYALVFDNATYCNASDFNLYYKGASSAHMLAVADDRLARTFNVQESGQIYKTSFTANANSSYSGTLTVYYVRMESDFSGSGNSANGWGGVVNNYEISNVYELIRLSDIVDGDVAWDSINSIDASLCLARNVNAVSSDRKYTDCYFALTADITEPANGGFTAIGRMSANSFAAKQFAGNSHSITYYETGTDYVGLFGYVTSSALTVSNLTVGGTANGTNYVGGFVGNSTGALTFASCINNVAVSGANYVGGFVGNSTGALTFTACVNNAAVTSTGDNIGGFVGKTTKSVSGSLTNNGAVSGANYVGGLIGSFDGGASLSNRLYATLVNSAAVVGSGSYAGGIVGKAVGNFVATSVRNTGNVTGGHYVGGVAGAVDYRSLVDDGRFVPLNFVYTTANQISSTITGNQYVGGLFGQIIGNGISTREGATVYNALAYSNVVNFTPAAVSNLHIVVNGVNPSYVGGLIGYMAGVVLYNSDTDEAYMISLANTLLVNVDSKFATGSYSGGAVGYIGVYSPNEVAKNASTFIGGSIIGKYAINSGVTSAVFGDSNGGNLDDYNYIGGIVGCMEYGAGNLSSGTRGAAESTYTFDTSANTGLWLNAVSTASNVLVITGNKFVGGLIGGMKSSGATVRHNTHLKATFVNEANVKGSSIAEYVGGIIGAIGYYGEASGTNYGALILTSNSRTGVQSCSSDFESVVSGARYVGGAAGYIGENTANSIVGFINTCRVGGVNTTGYTYAQSQNVGGIVGAMMGGVVSNSLSIMPKITGVGVSVDSDWYVGEASVGGIIGDAGGGVTMTSCYSDAFKFASVNSTGGGIAGSVRATTVIVGCWTVYLAANTDYTFTCDNQNGNFIIADAAVTTMPSFEEWQVAAGIATDANIGNDNRLSTSLDFGAYSSYVSLKLLVPNQTTHLQFFDASGNREPSANKYVNASALSDDGYQGKMLSATGVLFMRVKATAQSFVIANNTVNFRDVNYNETTYDSLTPSQQTEVWITAFNNGRLSDEYYVEFDGAPIRNGNQFTLSARVYYRNTASEGGTDFWLVGSIAMTLNRGSDAMPFTIANVSEWKTIATAVRDGNTYSGSTIKLLNDITLSANGGGAITGQNDAEGYSYFMGLIGANTSTRPFSGTFDGNGKTIMVNINISGMDNVALFPYAGTGAVFKNIVVDGSVSAPASADGNGRTDGKVNTTLGAQVGGIVAIAEHSCYFENCRNNADIIGLRNVGGIVGFTNSSAAASTTITMKDVVNTGRIEALDTVSYVASSEYLGTQLSKTVTYLGGAGGIIGNAEENSPASPTNITIDSARNSGYIVADACAGGIIGYCDANATIYNSANTGGVLAWYGSYTRAFATLNSNDDNTKEFFFLTDNSDSYAGGIIGGVTENGKSALYGTYNTGTVVAGGNKAGGLLGADSFGNTSNYSTQIYYCFNTGKVVAGGEDNIITGADPAGRRDAEGYITLDSNGCQSGGLIGAMANCTVKYCYNTGTIYVCGNAEGGTAGQDNQPRAGGLAGYTISADTSSFAYCYNAGEIIPKGQANNQFYSGGITGHVQDSDATDNPTTWSTTNNFSMWGQVNTSFMTYEQEWWFTYDYKDYKHQNRLWYYGGNYAGSVFTGNCVSLETMVSRYDDAADCGLVPSAMASTWTAGGQYGSAALLQGNDLNANLRSGTIFGYIYIPGCLPQLSIFAADTETGVAMSGQTSGYDTNTFTYELKQAGSEFSPYVIQNGIDLAGIAQLIACDGNATAYTAAGKYFSFADGENNLSLGQVAARLNELNMNTWNIVIDTAIGKDNNMDIFKGHVNFEVFDTTSDGPGSLGTYNFYMPYSVYEDEGNVGKNIGLVRLVGTSTFFQNLGGVGDATKAVNFYPIGGNTTHVFSGTLSGFVETVGDVSTTYPTLLNLKIYRDSISSANNNAVYAGLVGVGRSCTIENIVIKGTITAAPAATSNEIAMAGAFIGLAESNTKLINLHAGTTSTVNAQGTSVSDCSVVTTTQSGSTYTGGIAGQVNPSYSEYVGGAILTLQNCVSYANVTSSGINVGGIAGYMDNRSGVLSSMHVRFDTCKVKGGRIQSTVNTHGNVGGVLGSRGQYGVLELINCEVGTTAVMSSTTVKTAPAVQVLGSYDIGGIISSTVGESGASSLLEGCIVWADALVQRTGATNGISGTSIGGFIGHTDFGTNVTGDSYFYGYIDLNGHASTNVGGLIGYMGASTATNGTIHIYGTIDAGTTVSSSIGGAIGTTDDNTNISGYYFINPTMITDNSNDVGGFMGYNGGTCRILGTARIFDANDDVNAPAAATAASSEAVVAGSDYTATSAAIVIHTISGNNNVGGFIGRNVGTLMVGAQQDASGASTIGTFQAALITNVNGNNYVGGFVGYNEATITMNNVSITNTGAVCYGITAKATRFVGGIIGCNKLGATIEITDNATIINYGKVGTYGTTATSGTTYSGGVVGATYGMFRNYGTIANIGEVYGFDYVGGSIGYLASGTLYGTMSNGMSFSDSEGNQVSKSIYDALYAANGNMPLSQAQIDGITTITASTTAIAGATRLEFDTSEVVAGRNYYYTVYLYSVTPYKYYFTAPVNGHVIAVDNDTVTFAGTINSTVTSINNTNVATEDLNVSANTDYNYTLGADKYYFRSVATGAFTAVGDSVTISPSLTLSTAAIGGERVNAVPVSIGDAIYPSASTSYYALSYNGTTYYFVSRVSGTLLRAKVSGAMLVVSLGSTVMMSTAGTTAGLVGIDIGSVVIAGTSYSYNSNSAEYQLAANVSGKVISINGANVTVSPISISARKLVIATSTVVKDHSYVYVFNGNTYGFVSTISGTVTALSAAAATVRTEPVAASQNTLGNATQLSLCNALSAGVNYVYTINGTNYYVSSTQDAYVTAISETGLRVSANNFQDMFAAQNVEFGDVRGHRNVGGIVAFMTSAASIAIYPDDYSVETGFINFGDVRSDGADNSSVGGCIGVFGHYEAALGAATGSILGGYSDNVGAPLRYVEFFNYGTLTAVNNSGGCIGIFSGQADYLKMYNFSHLDFDGGDNNGGCIGLVRYDGVREGNTTYVKLTNSEMVNSGIVATDTRAVSTAGMGGVGGVIGTIYGTHTINGATETFESALSKASDWDVDLYADGSVSAGLKVDNVGGLIGQILYSPVILSSVLNYTYLDNNANITEVTGGDNVGGIIGYNASTIVTTHNDETGTRASVEYCYNVGGKVEGDFTRAGGVEVGGIVGGYYTFVNGTSPSTYCCYWVKGFTNTQLQGARIDDLGGTLTRTWNEVIPAIDVRNSRYQPDTWEEFIAVYNAIMETALVDASAELQTMLDNTYGIGVYSADAHTDDDVPAIVAEDSASFEELVLEVKTYKNIEATIEQNSAGARGYYTTAASKVSYSTGNDHTGYFFAFASNAIESDVSEHEIQTAHKLQTNTNDETFDLYVWKWISQAYGNDEAYGGSSSDLVFNANSQNIYQSGGATQMYHIYAAAYAPEVNGNFLYVKAVNEAGLIVSNATEMIDGQSISKFYINADTQTVGNVLIYYASLVIDGSLTYNGLNRYSPLAVPIATESITQIPSSQIGKRYFGLQNTEIGAVNVARDVGTYDTDAVIYYLPNFSQIISVRPYIAEVDDGKDPLSPAVNSSILAGRWYAFYSGVNRYIFQSTADGTLASFNATAAFVTVPTIVGYVKSIPEAGATAEEIATANKYKWTIKARNLKATPTNNTKVYANTAYTASVAVTNIVADDVKSTSINGSPNQIYFTATATNGATVSLNVITVKSVNTSAGYNSVDGGYCYDVSEQSIFTYFVHTFVYVVSMVKASTSAYELTIGAKHGVSAANYTFVSGVTSRLTITPKVLTASWSTDNYVYSGATFSRVLTWTGWIDTETQTIVQRYLNVISYSMTGALTKLSTAGHMATNSVSSNCDYWYGRVVFSAVDHGTYTAMFTPNAVLSISDDGETLSNYRLPTSSYMSTLTIAELPVFIQWVGIPGDTMIYDGTNHTISVRIYTVSGSNGQGPLTPGQQSAINSSLLTGAVLKVNGSNVSTATTNYIRPNAETLLNITATYSFKNANSYLAVLPNISNENFDWSGLTSYSFTVTPVTLEVSSNWAMGSNLDEGQLATYSTWNTVPTASSYTYTSYSRGLSSIKLIGLVGGDVFSNVLSVTFTRTADGEAVGAEYAFGNGAVSDCTFTSIYWGVYNVTLSSTNTNYVIVASTHWTINKVEYNVSRTDAIADFIYDGTVRTPQFSVQIGEASAFGEGGTYGRDTIESAGAGVISAVYANGINGALIICNAGTYTVGMYASGEGIAAKCGVVDTSDNYTLSLGIASATITVSPLEVSFTWDDSITLFTYNAQLQMVGLSSAIYNGSTTITRNLIESGSLVSGFGKTYRFFGYYPSDTNPSLEQNTEILTVSVNTRRNSALTNSVNAGDYNASISSDVSVTGKNGSGENSINENYVISSASLADTKSYTINKRRIYVTFNELPAKEYDATDRITTTISFNINNAVRPADADIIFITNGASNYCKYMSPNVGEQSVIYYYYLSTTAAQNFKIVDSDTPLSSDNPTSTSVSDGYTGEITKKTLTLTFASSKISKVYDTQIRYATLTHTNMSSGLTLTSSNYRNAVRGFRVSGFASADKNSYSIYADIREETNLRSSFDSYVNNVVFDGTDYYIDNVANYCKMIVISMTGLCATNYNLSVTSYKPSASDVSVESPLHIYDTDSALCETSVGLEIEVTKYRFSLVYNQTYQSYIQSNYKYTCDIVNGWQDVGYDTASFSNNEKIRNSGVTVVMCNNWKYLDNNPLTGQANPIKEYRVINGNANTPILNAKLEGENGVALNFVLANQPRLVIGFFITLDDKMQVSNLSGLMLASFYANNANLDQIEGDLSYTYVWSLLCTEEEYDNGVTTSQTYNGVTYTNWTDYVDAMMAAGEDIVYDPYNADSTKRGYGRWIQTEVPTEAYTDFVQTADISATLTALDYAILTNQFGTALGERDWGFGHTYLTDFIVSGIGSAVVVNGNGIFGAKFGGTYDGNGYVLKGFKVNKIVSDAEATTINVGLLCGYATNTAVFTNIGMRDCMVSVYDYTANANYINVGGVSGTSASGISLTNSTVHIAINVYAMGAATVNAGALVGLFVGATGSADTRAFANAIVMGSINVTLSGVGGVANVGGGIGAMMEGTSVGRSLSNIVSMVEIMVTAPATTVGGVIGRVVGSTVDCSENGILTVWNNGSNALAGVVTGQSVYMSGAIISRTNSDANWVTYSANNAGTPIAYSALVAGSISGYSHELVAGSNTVDNAYVAGIATTVRTYDVISETDGDDFRYSAVTSNGEDLVSASPRESTHLIDILDVYVLGYSIATVTGTTVGYEPDLNVYKKSATSWLVGAKRGTTANGDEIVLAYSQQVALLRMMRFASFKLVKQIDMDADYDMTAVYSGSFYGSVVAPTVNIVSVANYATACNVDFNGKKYTTWASYIEAYNYWYKVNIVSDGTNYAYIPTINVVKATTDVYGRVLMFETGAVLPLRQN